jgi:DNA ligase 1
MSFKFPTLYGIDKNDKIKQWDIQVDDMGEYTIMKYSYGYIDGRKTECTVRITIGKNIGKRNETTHFQQARLDAESRWTKKQDNEGYVLQKEALQLRSNSTETYKEPVQDKDQPLFPMLAHDLSKNKSKLRFPCYIQPKLDGYRMVYNPATNTMTSRIGKPFTILKGSDLEKQLQDLDTTCCLDGELYVHNPDFAFENYGVLRKQKNLTKMDMDALGKIQYHVYDIIDENQTYEQRLSKLKDIFEATNPSKIIMVDTFVCKDNADINAYHENFVSNGYEGSILRNYDAKYRKKYRSYDLLKKKDFQDDEFKIVGFQSEKDTSGNENPLVVWVCETTEHQIFSIRPKGVEEERRWLYRNAESFIGRKLWVKYFSLTEAGVPRFPTTVRDTYKSYIRDTIE